LFILNHFIFRFCRHWEKGASEIRVETMNKGTEQEKKSRGDSQGELKVTQEEIPEKKDQQAEEKT